MGTRLHRYMGCMVAAGQGLPAQGAGRELWAASGLELFPALGGAPGEAAAGAALAVVERDGQPFHRKQRGTVYLCPSVVFLNCHG